MCVLKSVKIRALWRKSVIPHFYVIDRSGKKWHFKLVEDLLPFPFYFLWFVGRYERIGKK